MNKIMIIGAVCAIASGLVGCAHLEAEWGGESAITDKDGQPYVVNGVVQKVKHPNHFESKRFGIDTKIDTGNMNVSPEGYSVGLNGYASTVSPENSKIITSAGEAVANITGRAIAAAMTAGVSEITRQAIPAIENISSQYIAAGGSLTPSISVVRDANGKLASFTITDGRVTQTGSVCLDCQEPGTACKDCTVPAAGSDAAAAK